MNATQLKAKMAERRERYDKNVYERVKDQTRMERYEKMLVEMRQPSQTQQVLSECQNILAPNLNHGNLDFNDL